MNIFRKEFDKKGGLCGIAAIYQALENTILTSSALAKLNYDTMKEMLGGELGIGNSKKQHDFDLLEKFHECRCFMFNLK